MKTEQKGFTLIELMIVIAIIGILASVALPAYREYIVTSKVGTLFQTVKGLQNSIGKTYDKKGSIVFNNIKYNCKTKACYQQYYGQPDVPVVPGQLSTLEVGAIAAEGKGTCSATTWVGTKGAATVSGGIIMTHPAAGSDNLIDENLAASVWHFHPQVSASGLSWVLNTDLAGTLATDGKEMETLVCKYLFEDVNGNG